MSSFRPDQAYSGLRSTTATAIAPRSASVPSAPGVSVVPVVQGVPTTRLDTFGHSVYSANPAPTDSLPIAAARDAMQALALLDVVTTGRILLVEPFTDSMIQTMRRLGFTGECVSWVRTPRDPADGWSDDWIAPLEQSDQVFVGDWLEFKSIAAGSQTASQPAKLTAPTGRFQLIVALELGRMLSPERHAEFLQGLTTLLAPLGFLIVGEPDDAAIGALLPPALTYEGLAQTADARHVTSDWSWRLTRWQLRSGRGAHRTGALEAITYAEIEANPVVQNAVVSAYREVFGGDEWSEWMYCPVCYRQYSRREYESLTPPDRCICEAHARLAVYHSPADVLLQAQSDLSDPRGSRLYARWDHEQERLDAFIWGYLTDPDGLAQSLLPRQGASEQQRFQQSLAGYLAQVGMTDAAPIYHQAFIGALEQSRNFGLVRAMFTRVCQFAIDQHAPVMVTATIPSINAFALLRGIGMEVIYTYPSQAEAAPDALPPVTPKPPQEEKSMLLSSRLDEQGVILAGASWSILSAITRASDRGLEVLVARTLRQMRSA